MFVLFFCFGFCGVRLGGLGRVAGFVLGSIFFFSRVIGRMGF